MSRAGEPSAVTWSLLGPAVAYAAAMVGWALVDAEMGVLLCAAILAPRRRWDRA
ncbi:hypothetical protein SAMN04489867_1920 [Pedococcus dokdonensis]|uniref:Uncharacterized protein n=1 Tax=Pedococcus dokdonensis TaxID=443156 RepID=A0A1H0RD27_9MICO|nr:hypothetical protein [Pedococcus dokdonensis]SDP27341.1 hypothetical protein SAMN04489867_1920 [Pedococcus dokdonensis]